MHRYVEYTLLLCTAMWKSFDNAWMNSCYVMYTFEMLKKGGDTNENIVS